MNPNISQAIILHHTDYGEADRIVTFLTPDHGRLKGFARAARKSRKRFGAALEPFAEVQLHWVARSSGDLISLRDAELVSLHTGLRRDLETLMLAGYGCELTEALFDESGTGVEVFISTVQVTLSKRACCWKSVCCRWRVTSLICSIALPASALCRMGQSAFPQQRTAASARLVTMAGQSLRSTA